MVLLRSIAAVQVGSNNKKKERTPQVLCAMGMLQQRQVKKKNIELASIAKEGEKRNDKKKRVHIYTPAFTRH